MNPVLTNRARASRLMSEGGIDAIVACSPANVRYLTGYWCWLAPLFKQFMVQPGGSGELVMRNLALLPRQGEACLVVEPFWALDARAGFVEDVRLAGAASFASPQRPLGLPPELAGVALAMASADAGGDALTALAGALTDRGLAHARVGVEREAFYAHELERLGRLLPQLEVVDCTNLLRLVRAVKTEEEIERLARAAEISERAALATFAEARPGVSVADLSRAFRARTAADGADFDHFAASIHGIGIVCDGSHAFDPGSASYVDFGCISNGWFADSGTTLCVGECSAPAGEAYSAVRDAVAAGAAAMAPGVPASVVQSAMQVLMAERGITQSFPHGHGVGLEVRDYPVVVPDAGAVIRDDCVEVGSDLPLEEGMVVNLEAPFFSVGELSVHCEQTFVVTASGSRPLIPQDRDAPVVVGGGA
ncbi:MAG: Xaa-Pro dipeptidase [Gaiellales bacterium]|nr:Xaa-Pro dipeptidase [Gaiellales bacterium]